MAESCLKHFRPDTVLPIPEKLAKSCPAACFALETALLDLESKNAGVSLAHHLNPSAADSILVNGIVGGLEIENILSMEKQGYHVIKVKIGLDSPSAEVGKLRRIAEKLENARLRLDANGAWSREQAQYLLSEIEDLPVESIEEPIKSPTLGALKDLQQNTRVPIAIDESLRTLGLRQIIAEQAVSRVVLKPMVLGGITPTLKAAKMLTSAGIEVVVTTALESAAGVWATTQLAAAIDPLCPGMYHGLDTSRWLERNIGAPPEIKHGKITLTDQPGTGFTPYE